MPFDLAVLLLQAGKPQDAINVFERSNGSNAPEYALLAMTRAYRDVGRFDKAETLAEAGEARFKGNPTWTVLRALILADSKRSDEAMELLSGPRAAAAPVAERKLAEAYALRAAGRPFDALRIYMEVLMLDPQNQSGRAEATSLLRELGAPNAAAEIVDRPEPITPGAARLPLSADQGAAAVRWGEDVRPPDPAHRFDGTDAALDRIDQTITETRNTPGADPGVLTRLRFDRLVALRDRVRMPEVIQDSDELIKEGIPLPPYAERARADALLYLQRPQEAAEAYGRALAGDPDDMDARYGLFYAQVESEDFDAAYKTIDELASRQPAKNAYVDYAPNRANPDATDAALTAGLARFYGDQLGEAEKRVAPIAAAAPANASARLANAEIMNDRGHPRAAEEEARIAASLSPIDPAIEKFLADLDMQAFRFSKARDRIDKLQAMYPEDIQVRRLAEELDAETGWLFEMDAAPGWSRGGGNNAMGQDLTVSGRLWSPPIGDHWRAFLLDDYSYAHPQEGFVDRNRTGAGIQFQNRDLAVTAYGTYSTGELEDPGAGATVDWWINDTIQVGVAGEIYSIDTPLRALISGVKANEVAAYATYRWHESRELTVSGAFLDFNDGNEQAQAGLNFQQRLVDIPHFDLTGRIGVFASAADRQDVNYYSPERDLTATVGFLAEHVLWRRYDDSLVQAFSFDPGIYAEEGFGTDWIGSIGYEHRWEFQPFTEFRYGVQLTRNVFDGDSEEGITLTFGLRQKF